MLWKRTATTANQYDRHQSSGVDEGSPKVQCNNGNGPSEILTQRDLKYNPPFKRVKVVHEKSPVRIYADGFLEHLDHGCNSQSLTAKDVCMPSIRTLFHIYMTNAPVLSVFIKLLCCSCIYAHGQTKQLL